jgi:hypothetical protein
MTDGKNMFPQLRQKTRRINEAYGAITIARYVELP